MRNACDPKNIIRLDPGVIQEAVRLARAEARDQTGPALISLLGELIDAVYNSAIAANPEAFVFAGTQPSRKTITVGTAEEIYTNNTDFPIMVNVRVETTEEDLKQYLRLSIDDKSEAEDQSLAPAVEWGAAPKRSVIIPPGKTLMADATAKTGTTTVNVVYTTVPMRGMGSWPTNEE